jgi:hypothetical protein
MCPRELNEDPNSQPGISTLRLSNSQAQNFNAPPVREEYNVQVPDG